MKKILLLFTLSLLPTWMLADASNVYWNGITYNFYTNSRVAEVTGVHSSYVKSMSFTGTLNIDH